MSKRFIIMATAIICAISILAVPTVSFAEMEIDAKSAILIEASTGKVLFEKNADEKLPPASVTKVMTLLLVMEAIDSGKYSLNDTVTVSDRAASMGGSQVFLESGEQMSVEDLLKSVVIASANDAAVALAEFTSGSEENFVSLMNQRATELGMVNTNFENTNGLDDNTDSHLTSARDIAIMSAELMRHEAILKYTCIWQDTIRNGEFTLTNTNRLVRFYSGANGLKTGSTSKAGFCISAAAKRDGMQLIAVIMGSSSRDNRNAAAQKLLNYGFANYSLISYPDENLGKLKLAHGQKNEVGIAASPFSAVITKGSASEIERVYELPEIIEAPICEKDVVGSVSYLYKGETIGKSDVYVTETANKITYFYSLLRLIKSYFMS